MNDSIKPYGYPVLSKEFLEMASNVIEVYVPSEQYRAIISGLQMFVYLPTDPKLIPGVMLVIRPDSKTQDRFNVVASYAAKVNETHSVIQFCWITPPKSI